MFFLRGAKLPIEMLYKRLGKQQGSCYYSTFVKNHASTSDLGVSQNSSYLFDCGMPMLASGTILKRYNSSASSSSQISLIKQLRERTSAPMKDVKSALVDCNWDIDAAQKELRKKGVALASKKASRTAAEGLLAVAKSENRVTVIELNCETDFVAMNDIFRCLAASIAELALLVEDSSQQGTGVFSFTPESLEDLQDLKVNLNHPKLDGERTLRSAVTDVAAIMGENIRFRRAFTMEKKSPGVLSTYLHSSLGPGLGRVAGLLSLEVEDPNISLDALENVGSELAMHVVALKPLFLTKELVPSDALASEREILKSQAEKSGKPQMVIEKMVEGRLQKYYEDVVFMEQKFIINESMRVETVLSNLSKQVNSPVKIGNFLRLKVGEGIQRLEANDSEPVAQTA